VVRCRTRTDTTAVQDRHTAAAFAMTLWGALAPRRAMGADLPLLARPGTLDPSKGRGGARSDPLDIVAPI